MLKSDPCSGLALRVLAVMRRTAWGLLTLMACFETGHVIAATVPESVRLIHPRRDCGQDARSCYPMRLLALALSKAGVTAELVPTPLPMKQGRAVKELQSNSGEINVMWTMTSREREAVLLPIRIPIDKGLFGWRVSLIKAERFDLFKSVDGLQALRSFTAGQGHDWPDTATLRGAGLAVETPDNFENLFTMLAAGRFDYFPRSVIEARSDVESHREQGLIVEPFLVLHYPTAEYFFVPRGDTVIAGLIEKGLERAVRDGSFDRLFYQSFASDIESLNLATRRVISLPDSELPAATPLNRPELWFHPANPAPSDMPRRRKSSP
jgi:hypothetical protein